MYRELTCIHKLLVMLQQREVPIDKLKLDLFDTVMEKMSDKLNFEKGRLGEAHYDTDESHSEDFGSSVDEVEKEECLSIANAKTLEEDFQNDDNCVQQIRAFRQSLGLLESPKGLNFTQHYESFSKLQPLLQQPAKDSERIEEDPWFDPMSETKTLKKKLVHCQQMVEDMKFRKY